MLKNTICIEEETYVENKKPAISSSLSKFIHSLDMVSFDNHTLQRIYEDPPIMGLAISGGGYRSMLTSTGFIKEMESCGIFDCLSYMSGLSGGSWVLMDLVMHDFDVNLMLRDWKLDDGLLEGIPDFDFKQEDLVSGMDEDELLHLKKLQERGFYEASDPVQMTFKYRFGSKSIGTSLFKRDYNPVSKLRELLFQKDEDVAGKKKAPFLASSLMDFQNILKFYIDLHQEVRPKRVKGFRVSFTDYLGKAFIKRLKEDASHRVNTTSFSKLTRDSDRFSNFNAPVPIFVCNCKNKSLKNIIFEFTPFEFGSWESLLRLFVKLPFLGSKFKKGKATACVNGFDDIGFITATSSSIFNNVLIYIWQLTAESSKETIKAVKSILSIFGLKNIKFNSDKDLRSSVLGQLNTDYAVVHPNPFYKYLKHENPLTADDFLYLVDGGEDGENIPLRPLTIRERKLDLIFVIDSSSDTNNFPSGIKLKNAVNQMQNGERYLASNIDYTLGAPIALGCFDDSLPIIIYQANGEHSYPSNTSTFKISYNESEVLGMLQNGREIFNADDDPYYKNCLGCLIMKRSFDKMPKSKVPPFCEICYENYCH